ncbi:flagellin Hag [Mahella australiensis]|uniref:Flagellin n=1 Tax=Mahella australiensis (strain DSM 15567 / CIP 107919 / 50-1 BON) TaxID=697281 RepID=F3ZZ04_MAHA5|nr:flagellin Hag [Mahella australiensis]AEE96763.1 flagellin domain protein [Mahella australiensis 50-1 BON]
MIINHNVMAMNAYRQLTVTNNAGAKALEKLSSGLRINRAGDDAAGLAISEKMRGQIRGLAQASRNAQDGISLIQTAEGGLNETHSILQRMRELVVQAANDTNTSEDRTQIQQEITELQKEIDRIASTTQFNTKTLLNGSLATTGLVFQIGANSSQTIELTIKDMHATALGASSVKVDDIDVEAASTAVSISAYLSVLDSAIDQVSTERAKLGAYQNRLEHTVANLDTSAENLQAAESRIRDVDMAKEMMEFTRTNILAQAGTAMLAQANAKPQTVLQLLQ